MVLEQRVRQVEAQPQAPQPQRLVKSIQPPAQARNDANAVAGTYGASLKDDGAPAPSVENIYQDASGVLRRRHLQPWRPASPTATTTPPVVPQRLPGAGLDLPRQHRRGPDRCRHLDPRPDRPLQLEPALAGGYQRPGGLSRIDLPVRRRRRLDLADHREIGDRRPTPGRRQLRRRPTSSSTKARAPRTRWSACGSRRPPARIPTASS